MDVRKIRPKTTRGFQVDVGGKIVGTSWKKRSNQELSELFNEPNVIQLIKTQKIRC